MRQQRYFYQRMGTDLITPKGEKSDQATNSKQFGLYFELSIELCLPRLLTETRLWLVLSLRQNIEKQPDYWIYPVPRQQLWNWRWQEWWDSLCHLCYGPSHSKKLSTISKTAFCFNLGYLASQNRSYQPVGTIHVRQRVPRSPIAEQKNVPVYPLRCLQDISASVTLAPIQPINEALPQSVNWLAWYRRQLGQQPGRRSCDKTSNDGCMRSHRNSGHLLYVVGQWMWKSAPGSEPCQLACKMLQSGHKSDRLGQEDESIQNDRMVQPEWHIFWAIRPRYTRPKRRHWAFWAIDYGKSMSNASVSQPTAQALKKNCVHGHLRVQSHRTSIEWLEVLLLGVLQLRFWQARSLHPKKTASSPPNSIWMQGVCSNKVKKGLPVLLKVPQAWRQSSYWLSCHLKINEYL